jgi:DNA-binding IclR family transcriptional regulator
MSATGQPSKDLKTMTESTKGGRTRASKGERPQRSIQSAETACHILKTIAAFNGEVTLGALSTRLGMLPGNVHRYLTSLQRHGFVTQERSSGEYDLGPAALALGARALRRMDQHDVVFQETRKLSKVLDTSVYAAVWVEDRPVVVMVHNRGAIGPLTARLGVQIPAIYSATGRVFLAYRDAAMTEHQWKLEYRKEAPPRADNQPLDLPRFQRHLEGIRERDGLARVRGDMTKGINALSAPVFDMWGHVVFVITAVGHAYELDASWDGSTAAALAATTRLISEKLGFDPAATPQI